MQEHLSVEEKTLNDELNKMIEGLETSSTSLKEIKSKSEILVYDDLSKLKNKIDLDVNLIMKFHEDFLKSINKKTS
jgi:hypothetical protein